MSGAAATPISSRALERRVKRWWLAGASDCFVACAPGLEPILLEEVRAAGLLEANGRGADDHGADDQGADDQGADDQGADDQRAEDHATEGRGREGKLTEPRRQRGGIELRLDPEGIMRANLLLRTANRVLLRLGDFHASTPAMLFDHLLRIPWEVHLGQATAYDLRLSSRASALSAGDALLRTASEAIERSMREHGLRPRLVDGAALTFHLRLLADRCTVSFDSSGEHLHRRGVRRHVHDAPLRETLAAAVLLGGYRDHDTIVDPFCGSGTLLIEAADLVAGRPPGRARGFAFEQAGWHRPGRWREVQRRASEAGDPRPAVRLLGIEIEPEALAAARHNLAGDGYERVDLRLGDSRAIDLDALGAQRGLLVGNLPYGVRLGDRATAAKTIERFLGRCLAASRPWDFSFLTMHAELFEGHAAVQLSSVRQVSSSGLKLQWVRGRIG